METTLKIRSKHWEDVGLMISNATFNDGVELIYRDYDGKIEVSEFIYLNGKDANLYISLLTNEQK
jgi:hypothetical protein